MYGPLEASVNLSRLRILFFTHCFQGLYSRPSSVSPEKKRSPPSEVDDVVAAMCADLHRNVKQNQRTMAWSRLFRRLRYQPLRLKGTLGLFLSLPPRSLSGQRNLKLPYVESRLIYNNYYVVCLLIENISCLQSRRASRCIARC